VAALSVALGADEHRHRAIAIEFDMGGLEPAKAQASIKVAKPMPRILPASLEAARRLSKLCHAEFFSAASR
jgi:hypothetical protein